MNHHSISLKQSRYQGINTSSRNNSQDCQRLNIAILINGIFGMQPALP